MSSQAYQTDQARYFRYPRRPMRLAKIMVKHELKDAGNRYPKQPQNKGQGDFPGQYFLVAVGDVNYRN